MKIIIPASGIGKRFIDAGYKDTKPLIIVLENKKIMDYVFDCFDIKNDEFFIIVSQATFGDMEKYLKSLPKFNWKLFISSGSKLGPVGAITDVEDNLSDFINDWDEVIVSYCDYGMEWNYKDFLNYLKDAKPAACIPCYTGEHPHLEDKNNVYAACKTYENTDRIYSVKEKYESKNRNSEYWSAGLYYFSEYSLMKEAFQELIEHKDMLNGEYYVSLAYNYILDGNVTVYKDINRFYQFGTPKDFEYAKNKLAMLNNLKNDKCEIKNIVILSAGKGERFLNLGFNQPKPFIPLGETDFITNISNSLSRIKSKIRYIGSLEHEKYWTDYTNVHFVMANKIGAAYSYSQAAYNIFGETLIVPCDLIAKYTTDEFSKIRTTADAIIFTTKPTEYSLTNKNSFAWVNSLNGKVNQISIKEHLNNNQNVLIGSFWVKDNTVLMEAISKIIELGLKTNGEYYLDNAFKYLVDAGFDVQEIVLDKYFSLGTPAEYKENGYFLNGVFDD